MKQWLEIKKILILANNDVGLYKFRKELIQTLIKQDKEIFISLPEGEYIRNLEALGCNFISTKIDRRGINPITDFHLLLSYFRLVRSIKPDLVIAYTIKPNIYGGIIARLVGIPCAINITGLGSAFQRKGLLRSVIVYLYQQACKKAITVFFENCENQKTFIDEKIIPIDRTCLLNGAGVNLEEYPFTEYPPEGNVKFLFIGRIMKEKGVDELFSAAIRLKAEHDHIDFDVVGPMEEDFADIIDKLVQRGIINYHGFQNDVRPFIERCHCLVLPSYHEGMANTLLEAGAMGRPLITSDIPGCREAVIDEETGLLVQVQNITDLFKSLERFINYDYYEKKRMGVRSYRYIKEMFNKSKIVKSTIERLVN